MTRAAKLYRLAARQSSTPDLRALLIWAIDRANRDLLLSFKD